MLGRKRKADSLGSQGVKRSRIHTSYSCNEEYLASSTGSENQPTMDQNAWGRPETPGSLPLGLCLLEPQTNDKERFSLRNIDDWAMPNPIAYRGKRDTAPAFFADLGRIGLLEPSEWAPAKDYPPEITIESSGDDLVVEATLSDWFIYMHMPTYVI
ncbi:hypothetical protein TWF481_006223 [Arthrobotrys musiformis]|uniref:Uncharacterized protein n=1 Tax=Arthrobotrys musiformis TaxID=47236 RepID=A0AAV9WH92_9PEZI